MSEKLSAAGKMMDGEVITLTDDIIFTCLSQEGGIAWTLCQPLHSGSDFILASAAVSGYEAVFQTTQRLKNEFSMRARLSGAWAIKPMNCTSYHGHYALVYAPFPFRTLAQSGRTRGRSLTDFLSLAIRLCTPLRQMHAQGLIHSDIKPGHFFIDPGGAYRLGGFGLTSGVDDATRPGWLTVSGGTPVYMSPEHTARTPDNVDRRSDLYSLGVVLYELLTGELPFDLNDGGQAEWTHHHIASSPRSPCEVRADVPPTLAEIILRLLKKSPENRYQTVEGLIADLRRCQASLVKNGEIASFTPGLQDREPARMLPDPLFLNHPQHTQLLAAFDRVEESGSHALVIVSGPPGSGKSSLISSALKKLQQRRTLLAISRADPYSPVLPYTVIASAFRSLVLWLLGLEAEDVARWKMRLARSLGSHAALAIKLVPELGLLLDSRQLTVVNTQSADTRMRFNLMAHRLVEAFATPDCPLVLLIGDIHWIDQASLQLLEYLLSSSESLPLLVVVSCSDTDTFPDSGEQDLLSALRARARYRLELRPEPLSVKAVSRWLANMLQTRASGLGELAALIHEKTDGNPLFTHEFFQRIFKDGLITHHKEYGKWHYDLEAIRSHSYTENVASLVLQQLAEMPLQTRTLLGCLACVGPALLCQVLEIAPEQLHQQLQPAVAARLIGLSAEHYRFTHDRVHDAALALLDAEEVSRLNFVAARLLTDAAAQDDSSEHLFLAVHHITSAIDRVRLSPQRDHYRAVCRLAAQRARLTGDYASAVRYLRTAKCLPGDSQASATEENFSLAFEEAECEFLQGNLPAALTLCHQLMAAPGSLQQKAMAAGMLAEVHMRQSDMSLALETSLAWLPVFGIHLSRNPTDTECDELWQALETRLGDAPEQHFRQLTLIEDPDVEAIMNLMLSASMFSAFASPRLHFILLARIMLMSLEHGLSGACTTALAWYGVMIGCRYHQYEKGYVYTLLGHSLVSDHQLTQFTGRTWLAVDLCSAWVKPLSTAIEHAKACFTASVDHGDLTAACFVLRHQTMNFLTRGDHLDGVLSTIEGGLGFVRKLHFPDVEIMLSIQRLYVNHLRSASSGTFSGHNLFADTLLKVTNHRESQPIPLAIFWFWLYRGMAHFMAGEYADASRCLAKATPVAGMVPGYIHLLDYHFYSALSQALSLSPEEITADQREKLTEHYQHIARWAGHNPATFADKAALVRAELARLDRDNETAIAQYEQAIALSEESECHPMNGLACELAGRFAKATGWVTAAEGYFRNAFAAWHRWGAIAKVRHLERQYPYLAPSDQRSPYDTIAFAQNEVAHDLESVLRAVRAMTEEIDLDRLINTLMTILLERAGAQRGLLIRIIDNTLAETQAWAETSSEGVKVEVVRERPTATDMPLSVLAAVMRTGQEIRISKPELFGPFSQDPYLVTSGAAILCVPMHKQGKLVGVLYLENRVMPEIFTAEHSRIVRMLAAQAAVSLETARLYAELVEENVQRRRAEKELRTSQTSLMLGEKISNTGTWRWELEQDVMFVSDEYARILGLPEQQRTLSMADFMTLVHPEDFQRINTLVNDSVRNGVSMRAEFRIFRPDGDCRYILGVGNPVGYETNVAEYFGVITDITARRLSEDAVRVAQADLARVSRATTVGQLTASIAHEINQPLMSIVANAGASLRWMNREPPMLANARSSIEEIISEGERAGNIIRSLQALTRNQTASCTRINLHHLVYRIVALSRSELERQQIALHYHLNAEETFIFGDSVQIQQVLLNLIVNAIDAMAGIDDRHLALTVSSDNPGPGQIRLAIADTGTGLSKEVQERLFDSFYTTKEQGMGMGLSISYGIIEKHQGKLTAEPLEPYGSLFTFILPTHSEEE
ncbi:trifunctional serine/threonine-protein kinase/ATP-binding protein/sensor histidine kinase [Phytobacter sp. V91]|uniref:ATP-binding sensor histidine kinase n=1 Tax=Phytobacter sp. V91 TaxID=3369425 RepID=UPI003F629171